MTVYHVETQQDYDALMSELEEKWYSWVTGQKPTYFRYWEKYGVNTCIEIVGKEITFGPIEWYKKEYPDTPIIKYKAKGENMTEEEIKQKLQVVAKLHEVAFDISVAIGTFARGTLTVEADLQEAKSAAKNLIENIDEYLESLKPEFKVGDYAVELDKYITKIEKNDDGMLKGHFYMPVNKHFSNIKDNVSVSKARHATPEEIAEYESALNFHKHGRKPFELKKGDLLYDKNSENCLTYSGIAPNMTINKLKKGEYIFVKTREEVNELLENK